MRRLNASEAGPPVPAPTSNGASVLFELLMSSLDRDEQQAVLDAIARHNAEVAAAEAAGERAVEAR